MIAPWLRLGSQTDIATAPRETVFTLEDGFVLAETAARPDYWFGNYAIVPAAASERILAYADAVRRRLPRASRDIVLWETASCEIARGLPDELDYARRCVMASEGRVPYAATDAAIRVEGDATWHRVLELVVAEAEGSPAFWAWYVHAMRARCESGAGAWWAVERNGNVVATLGLLEAGSGTSRFAHIVTGTQQRRSGLASALMRHAMAYASAASRFVVVAELETPAQHLYETLGFRAMSCQHVLMRQRS